MEGHCVLLGNRFGFYASTKVNLQPAGADLQRLNLKSPTHQDDLYSSETVGFLFLFSPLPFEILFFYKFVRSHYLYVKC